MAQKLKVHLSSSSEAIDRLKSDSEVAIICGGLGKRLGGLQKGSILYNNERLIDRISRLGKDLGSSLSWVERTALQMEDPLQYADQRLIDDPLGGAAGGIIAALKACQKDWIWTFACDLPLLELTHLIPIAEQAFQVDEGCSGLAFIDEGRPQPLAALWRARCHSALEGFIRQGGSLSRFLSSQGVLLQIEPLCISTSPNLKLSPLFNVNRPVDLEVLNALQS